MAMLAGGANAGRIEVVPVDVNLEAGAALGSQTTAKTSANDNEFIGCGTRRTSLGNGAFFDFGFCQAGDAAGNQAICFTFDLALIEAMRSQNSYSFITFGWQDDGAGGFECTRVGFSTQSFYLPDKKVK
jgi:hypothetical protein